MKEFQYKLLSLVMAALLAVSMFFVGREAAVYVAGETVDAKQEKLCVVIDAGHGGDDPGKVGINGANEKDINLEIAELVKGREPGDRPAGEAVPGNERCGGGDDQGVGRRSV